MNFLLDFHFQQENVNNSNLPDACRIKYAFMHGANGISKARILSSQQIDVISVKIISSRELFFRCASNIFFLEFPLAKIEFL